jgi:hypothetical protein
MKISYDKELKNRGISRREFLKRTGSAVGFLLLCRYFGIEEMFAQAAGSRVVVVNDDQSTTWDGSTYWYGSDTYVNQARLDDMIKEGVKFLTGQSTEIAAWNQIIPTYNSGTKIAIKMNENNGGSGGNVIDPLPQLLKALVKSLTTRGIAESDIWFVEPSIGIDERVARPVKEAYPGITFYGASGTPYSSPCTYNSSDPSLMIDHGHPSINSSRLPDQIGSSTYLIHMPILKAHGFAGITLTYKNLIGLFQRSTIPKFHDHLFDTTDNPLVEIFANSHVGGKTCLIIGDGIYGNWQNNFTAPPRWSVFGNDWPKRIFFATDPVAIDCVMCDFLDWQNTRSTQHETYLVQAANTDQGIRDHWNNSTEKAYSAIDFVQLDMDTLFVPEPPAPPTNLKILG